MFRSGYCMVFLIGCACVFRLACVFRCSPRIDEKCGARGFELRTCERYTRYSFLHIRPIDTLPIYGVYVELLLSILRMSLMVLLKYTGRQPYWPKRSFTAVQSTVWGPEERTCTIFLIELLYFLMSLVCCCTRSFYNRYGAVEL